MWVKDGAPASLLFRRSRRRCGPSISARLTLQDQHVLQDIYDDGDRLLAAWADQSGFVNVGQESKLLSRALVGSTLGRNPDVATARAAEKQVRVATPSKDRHDDAIVSVALSARLANASFCFFLKLREIRHRGVGSIPRLSTPQKLNGRNQYSRFRKENPDESLSDSSAMVIVPFTNQVRGNSHKL